MLLKNIDIISPKITFHYNGSLAHSSIFSGILSIIVIILIIAFSTPFINDLIKKKNFNAYYLNSFIEDAPTLMINSTSLFHFVSLELKGHYSLNLGFDFTVFRIIGTLISFHSKTDIKKIDHWLYGFCNNTDAEGINHLIPYDFFNKSACIKKYYDSKTKKYYDKGHPIFKYPSISHGSFKDNNIIYNLYVQKCDDNMIGDILGEGFKCKTTEEMNEYFDNLGDTKVFEFYFLNNYVNISSYNNPINKFIYTIDSPFYPNHYTANNININPSKIITDNGVILDSIKEEDTYMLERNDVIVINKENENFYVVYAFILKNIINIYERNYSKLYQIISDIGGVFEILLLIASFINSMYNDYISLYDTSELLNFLIDKEKNSLKDENNNNKGQIKINLNNSSLSNNKEEDKKYEAYIIKNEEILKMKPGRLPPLFPKNGEKNITGYSTNNEMLTDKNINSDGKKEKNCSTKNTEENIDNNIVNVNTLEKNKKGYFCGYILYLITCKKKNSFYSIYKEFREKIISEEHLVRNHLNIYSLIRISKQNKFIRKHSYKINDLMFSL